MERNRCRFTVRYDGPGDPLRAKIFWHINHKHAPLPAGEEMRRLSEIGSAWIDVIVRTYGYIHGLSGIAVVVTDKKIEGTVRKLVPTFISRRDILAGSVNGVKRQLRRRLRPNPHSARERDHRAGAPKKPALSLLLQDHLLDKRIAVSAQKFTSAGHS